MPAATYTAFPSFNNAQKAKPSLNPITSSTNLSHTFANMPGPGSPFIKEEPEDFNNFSGFDMSQQFNGQAYNNNNSNSNVNPSDLTMSGSFINNQYGGQNMSSSFIMGNSNIADDELLELGNLDEQDPSQQNYMINNQGTMHQNQNFYDTQHRGSIQIQPPSGTSQMYSNTPDGAPIMSPFVHDFNYSQFRPMQQQGNGLGQSLQNGAFDMHGRPRAKMHNLDRHPSDSRSPLTPRTPAISSLQLGTPDSGSFGSHPIQAAQQQFHRHQKSISGQWDQTPGSAHSHSWLESPGHSPHAGSMHHPQISEVLTSGKHASLPAKVGMHQNPNVQEAKKKKRRESHNLVERRRRDNINERIQDLSKLVPGHRLEDEKIRKHITNNGPMSPTLGATGISPPQATSLLAGGTGRRAAGNITQGLPLDEKEKGPNKGDILNGAVSWTRDLMWMLNMKLEQEEHLKDLIRSQGAQWPFPEQSEDEKRMRTELVDSVDSNGKQNFHYSRAPGSGLRVPKHTNYAGDPIDGSSSHRLSNGNTISPQSLSPAMHNGSTSGDSSGNPQFWMGGNNGNFSLKEEDEFGMDLG